jgi:hypothetical protein
MPDAEAAALPTPDAPAPELAAVRALLAAERARAAPALPPSDAEWRFLLALYEAALDGRALTPSAAAEAAAVPLALAPAIADNFESQDFLAADSGGTLRLTGLACDHLAIWVEALTPLVTPRRAAAAAPPQGRPPEPPG